MVNEVTKDDALTALVSISELMYSVPDDMEWLTANLLNWLVEPEVDGSESKLHNILWGAGEKFEDVLVLLKYLFAVHSDVWTEFPDEAREITKFCDKALRRRYMF